MYSSPLAYFLTFRTYGSWLHGDPRGSIDPDHNIYNHPALPANAKLVCRDEENLRGTAPVVLDAARRESVERTIRSVASYKRWALHAMHVRTNHVHAIVQADREAEQVMLAFKSWSTRRMIEEGLLPADMKAWSRHGSTRYLFDPKALEDAVHYVLCGQGEELG